ncbi:MAG: hypothetical protein HY302_10640 [Opitutae bacterium]|nr:hypothetical protein [Opitutae bacterium]
MDKPWKIALVLLGIFVAGALTGGAISVRIARKMFAARPGPEQWTPLQMKRLADRLELTPEQTTLLHPIVRRNMEELNRLRTYSFAETRSIVERMHREIVGTLTPEQRSKFEQMNKELRERALRFQPGRGPRPFGPGDGPRRFGPGSDRDRPMRERPPGDKPADRPADAPPPKPSGG